MLKKFLGYGALEGASRFLNWAMIFLLGIFLAPSAFGKISLVVAMEGVLLAIFVFGLDRSVLRYYHEQPERILTIVLRVWGGLSLGLAAILLLANGVGGVGEAGEVKGYSHWLGVTAAGDWALVLLLALVLSFHRLCLAIARVEDDLAAFRNLRILVQVVRFVLVLGAVVWLQSDPFYTYIVGTLVPVTLMCVIYFIPVVLRYRRGRHQAPDKRVTGGTAGSLPYSTRQIIRFSLPFIPHVLFSVFLSYIDRFMLANYMDETAVGRYTFAYMLGSCLSFLYAFVAIVYEPYLFRQADNPERISRLQKQYLTVLLTAAALASTGLLGGVFLFAPWFEARGYTGVTEITPMILVAHMVHVFYLRANNELALQQKTGYIALASFLAAVFNVAMNAVLIPVFGIAGAAMATLGGYLLMALVIMLFAGKHNKRFIDRDVVLLFAAMVMVSLAVCRLLNHWSVMIPVVAVLLLSSLMLLRTLGRQKLVLTVSQG